jgi:hypothetical protein
MNGDKFVDMICSIELKGIRCSGNILWENGNTGEQYKVDPSHEGYQVFCVVCIVCLKFRVRVREFNAPYNIISVIPWWSVLLVEKTRVPTENH